MSVSHPKWKDQEGSGSVHLKRQLVAEYAGLVRYVVNRYKKNSEYNTLSILDMDDLFQVGMIGLLEAIDRFDESLGVKFESFAIPRIRGAVQDELRKLDWVPRSVRARVKSLDKAIQEIESSRSHEGSERKNAETLALTIAEYRRLVGEANSMLRLSTQRGFEDEEMLETTAVETELDPFEQLSGSELRTNLTNVVDSLPEQDRLLVSLYYYEELTFKEVGKILGISESRVFQRHSALLKRLREKLKDLL